MATELKKLICVRIMKNYLLFSLISIKFIPYSTLYRCILYRLQIATEFLTNSFSLICEFIMLFCVSAHFPGCVYRCACVFGVVIFMLHLGIRRCAPSFWCLAARENYRNVFALRVVSKFTSCYRVPIYVICEQLPRSSTIFQIHYLPNPLVPLA